MIVNRRVKTVRKSEETCLNIRHELIGRKRKWFEWNRSERGDGNGG